MKQCVLLVFLFLLSGNLPAQNKNPEWKPVTYKGKSYLHGGLISSGTISKALFDSLIAYPLVAKDSLNAAHPVVSFYLTYAERGLYEDSTGRLKIMTDYIGTNSEKGVVPAIWLKSLRERTKAEDTVMISNILFLSGGAKPEFLNSEPIKLILTP